MGRKVAHKLSKNKSILPSKHDNFSLLKRWCKQVLSNQRIHRLRSRSPERISRSSFDQYYHRH